MKAGSRLVNRMPAPLTLVLAGGLLAVALGEVMPPLGRFVPGQLFIGLLAAFSIGLGHFSPWQPAAVLVGTFAGDLVNFARSKHHPRFLVSGRNRWWLPGHELDRLESDLRHSLVRTYFLRRFRTQERALLPLSAAAIGVTWPRFVATSAVACVAWTVVWFGAGAAIALAFTRLSPALGIALLLGFLLLATRPEPEQTAAA